MRYQVTVNNTNSVSVSFGPPKRRVVDVNEGPSTISGSSDVDLDTRQDQYLLLWNETSQKHEYIPASDILDRADNVVNEDIDYGTY